MISSTGLVYFFRREVSVVMGSLQVKKQIRRSDILDRVVLLAGFHAEIAGHICFSAPGRAVEEDIPVVCDILTVRHAFDLCILAPLCSTSDLFHCSVDFFQHQLFRNLIMTGIAGLTGCLHAIAGDLGRNSLTAGHIDLNHELCIVLVCTLLANLLRAMV